MVDAEESRRPRASRYANEDTTPTTDQELKGWYSYGLAAEVYAVCGVGSFLPVTLEQLARERGVLRSDGVTSCIAPKASESATRATGVGNHIMKLLLRDSSDEKGNQCIVHPFGKEVSTASFAMYTFSVAVLVQALVLISFSAVADHGTYRKKLLLAFGFVGSLSSMFFLFVSPRIYLIGSLLVVIGVVCLGSSFVLLNSFLPLLAWNHPSVAHNGDKDEPTSVPLDTINPLDGRMRPVVDDEEFSDSNESGSPALSLSTKISSKGVGIGYIAAVFMQLVSIALLVALNKMSFSSASMPMRVVLFFVGAWWAAFTIPSALWLRDRPGPPLKSSLVRNNKAKQVVAYVFFAWTAVWKTVMVAVKMRQTIIFLVAWFLLSDAIATVSGTAILFARTELHMGTVPIAILSITVTTSGIAGAFLWPVISRRFRLPPHKTIVACMILMEIIPIYGLIGFLPFVQTWGVGGLQQMWEIYPLGVVHGFIMGGLSSYCRSFYGLLIPPGSEAAFYALYAVTDKGSSAVGPAIVGSIVDATGSIRPAFGFLAVLIAIPIPLILMINVERGRADAVQMADTLGKHNVGEYEAVVHDSDDEDSLLHEHSQE
ncbi:hypothetical protein MBLNU459_g2465t1 [Dothideomycetes sp. NU459]